MKSLRRKICIMEKFTRVYQEFRTADPSIRELRCLEVLFPAILQPIGKHDRFVGRIERLPIGFALCEDYLGFFYDESRMRAMLKHPQLSFKMELRLRTLEAFWRGENSITKIRSAQRQAEMEFTPDKMRRFRNFGVIEPFYHLSGVNPNYTQLVQKGIPGLRSELEAIDLTVADEQTRSMVTAMMGALNILVRVINQYVVYARDLTDECTHEESKAELLHIATALETISDSKPTNLREAIQLIHLYSLISGVGNYGRMDIYLGGFLARDLASERLTNEQAMQLLESFWELINSRQLGNEGRVVVGGKGRPNVEDADQFALLALEASSHVMEPLPQICVRYHNEQNEQLLLKTLSLLSDGNVHPMLFNDDVLIPSIMQNYFVAKEDAKQYIPTGNGGFVLWHRSVMGSAGAINLLKILELALNGGLDLMSGAKVGPDFGKLTEFYNLEGIWDAFSGEVEYFVEALAIQEEILFTVMNREASFIFPSLLYDNCLHNAKPLLNGNIPLLGGSVEVGGASNVSRSMTAIESVVFRDKLLYPVKLNYITGEDYNGFENERELLSRALQRDDNRKCSVEYRKRIERDLCRVSLLYAREAGMHHFMIFPANGSINRQFGRKTGASADGRKAMTELECSLNHRIAFDQKVRRITFPSSEVLKQKGMHQFQISKMPDEGQQMTILQALRQLDIGQMVINVLDKQTLEAARRDPQNYRDVMVGLGAGTVRFVELDADTQEQIIMQLGD